MTEICSIIHKCTIHGEKNYMNLDFSSPLMRERMKMSNYLTHRYFEVDYVCFANKCNQK